MSSNIYPRSPRELMDGWVHLPRFIDKIRLRAAGKLAPDYLANVGTGFDGAWLAAAGVTFESFEKVVLHSITDGEVCHWVQAKVKRSRDDKQAFETRLLKYGTEGETLERLKIRKKESGFEDREDIRCMFDYIDADEGRLG